MANWKLMVVKGYYQDYQVIVRYDSPLMITMRTLTGRITQTKKGYIDYPSLQEPKKHRIKSFINLVSGLNNLRSMTADELAIYQPLLDQALVNQGETL